jgi:GDPmannose 4,6-dehydratase
MHMTKTALLTGLTGQDGSYLAELLLSKGYRVIGHVRPSACDLPDVRDKDGRPGKQRYRDNLGASQHLRQQVDIHCFDETCHTSWNRLLEETQPDEVYHLGASSSVRESWLSPLQINHANIDVTTMLLEAIRRYSPRSKFFFACSSEVFGLPEETPQDENTPFKPCTPYGVSKAAGYWLVHSYRQRYGLFLCSGLLFNHESPRRPEAFVSRKITRGAVKIKLGMVEALELGDLSASRDWGYAGDFVEAMWRMLQLEQAEDFVIGTGQLYPTSHFVELAFAQVGLTPHEHIVINPALFRPHDPRTVVANIDKARTKLGWVPRTSLQQLVENMVQADMDSLTQIGHNAAAA